MRHTAGRLWELLGGGHSIEAANAVLRDEFQEELTADVTAEVERMVADMVERGLLRPA